MFKEAQSLVSFLGMLAEDDSGRSELFQWRAMLLLQPDVVVRLAGWADPGLASGLVLYAFIFEFSVVRFGDHLLCGWRGPTLHTHSIGVLISGILFRSVTNQLSSSGQDTDSLNLWFSHLWTRDGTCLAFMIIWVGQRKLGGEILWETYTCPSLNSTIILGLIFIQSHDGKTHHGLYINVHLSETHFKINIIFIKF